MIFIWDTSDNQIHPTVCEGVKKRRLQPPSTDSLGSLSASGNFLAELSSFFPPSLLLSKYQSSTEEWDFSFLIIFSPPHNGKTDLKRQ